MGLGSRIQGDLLKFKECDVSVFRGPIFGPAYLKGFRIVALWGSIRVTPKS